MNDCESSPFGCKNPDGYYVTKRKRGGPNILLHRLVWERHNGQIPKGIFVCHVCDNPSCINITHLFLGTNSDNMKDMYAKGRGNNYLKNKNPNKKLTLDQVEEIRKKIVEGLSENELASIYNVHRSNINYIKNNKTWKQEELNK
jgi:hypothetical protein